MKQHLLEKLNQFDHQFKESKGKVTIITDSALEVDIMFREGKITIEGHLRKYNFLTGFLHFNITKVYTYLTIYLSIFLTAKFYLIQTMVFLACLCSISFSFGIV